MQQLLLLVLQHGHTHPYQGHLWRQRHMLLLPAVVAAAAECWALLQVVLQRDLCPRS
jgi:hypothetical protein